MWPYDARAGRGSRPASARSATNRLSVARVRAEQAWERGDQRTRSPEGIAGEAQDCKRIRQLHRCQTHVLTFGTGVETWRQTPFTFHPPQNLPCSLARDRSSPTRPRWTARAVAADSAAPSTPGATEADAVRSATGCRTAGCLPAISDQLTRAAGSERNDVGRKFRLRFLPLVQQFNRQLELIGEGEALHRMRDLGLGAHDLSHVRKEVPPAPSISIRPRPTHAHCSGKQVASGGDSIAQSGLASEAVATSIASTHDKAARPALRVRRHAPAAQGSSTREQIPSIAHKPSPHASCAPQNYLGARPRRAEVRVFGLCSAAASIACTSRPAAARTSGRWAPRINWRM
jgi:hypothetical protein